MRLMCKTCFDTFYGRSRKRNLEHGHGSGFVGQNCTVPAVPVPVSQHWSSGSYCRVGYLVICKLIVLFGSSVCRNQIAQCRHKIV
jgi:hypothetical protein